VPGDGGQNPYITAGFAEPSQERVPQGRSSIQLSCGRLTYRNLIYLLPGTVEFRTSITGLGAIMRQLADDVKLQASAHR